MPEPHPDLSLQKYVTLKHQMSLLETYSLLETRLKPQELVRIRLVNLHMR